MKYFRWIVISVFVLLIISFSSYVYIGLNGNPLLKYSFKKDVEKYLDKNYPGTEFDIKSVGYGFKEMNYYGNVSPKNNNNLNFIVGRNSRDELFDTFLKSTLEYEVASQCEFELRKFFPESTCNSDVRLDSERANDKTIPFPKYDAIKNLITNDSKIMIQINGKDNKGIEEYKQEIIEFISCISDLNINLSISFNDRSWYLIERQNFTKIAQKQKLIFKE